MSNLLLAAQQPQGQLFSSIFMFALIGIAFYFLLIRPQKKQQQEFKQAMSALKVGDIVVTRSGAKGKVIEVKDETFIIETGNNNTQIEYLKQALSHIVSYDKESSVNNSNSQFANVPVGDFSYGNDKRFLDKIEELKAKKDQDRKYDLLLEDVYEFIVVENDTEVISIQNKFRLDEERANKIVEDLEYLGVLSNLDLGKRRVLIDPRN
ncbi:preprotein translocase subunit YajC [Helcococcus ovis]|uniref:Preprotein translocase subunit YajC n=1 Tax=Helcococcus ovis TaxID=72026 RepID=A0A4R9C265_9FIRM|nr:preprotein translocase subunit YajC [Helcococcus ovis]TFF64460.1 preprotein translocase subunit YajC [Helcococcus ovis]TFF64692.1 preprotein translocase subunit YajC [Helcococcus ovis]TFF68106.1 preprotein translocase subunit YajC [Helcococcus ovis]WNZ01963.1 preprotein translocase subunit YajC [Helcococcus ovis]